MKDKQEYIFVYQTICEVNGKSYVGFHTTKNVNDGYIGCGIRNQNMAKGKQPFHAAVRKYGYASFKRHILSFYDTVEEALAEETYIVNERWVRSNDNYNAALGGRGYLFAGLSKEEISAIYKGPKNHRYGKPAQNRRRVIQYNLNGEKITTYESAKDAGSAVGDYATNISNTCRGKYGQCKGFIFRYERYSENELEILNKNLLNRKRVYKPDGTWEMTQDVKDEIKRRPPAMLGRKMSEETKIKQSLIRTGRKLPPCSEERKRKIGDANRGRKLIIVDGKRKSVKPV